MHVFLYCQHHASFISPLVSMVQIEVYFSPWKHNGQKLGQHNNVTLRVENNATLMLRSHEQIIYYVLLCKIYILIFLSRYCLWRKPYQNASCLTLSVSWSLINAAFRPLRDASVGSISHAIMKTLIWHSRNHVKSWG